MKNFKAAVSSIPYCDLNNRGSDVLVEKFYQRSRQLIDTNGWSSYWPLYKSRDGYVKKWFSESASPYLKEMKSIEQKLGKKGTFDINTSFHSRCLSGFARVPGEEAMRMTYLMELPLKGGGRNPVVSQHNPKVGAYYNITWPGLVGVFCALAPHRFMASINSVNPQEGIFHSLTHRGLSLIRGQPHKKGLPPTHLLRYVFETCSTFEEAKEVLYTTPVTEPVLFSLCGAKPAQGSVIEKLSSSLLHDSMEKITLGNYSLSESVRSDKRYQDDCLRCEELSKALEQNISHGFCWLKAPVLTSKTALTIMLTLGKTNALKVQGWEKGSPTTHLFDLGSLFVIG